MTRYRPFVDDPVHIAQLLGQRYVVLRVTGALYESYRRVETEVRRRLQGLPVSYPAQPHVTLIGLDPTTSEAQVRDLVSDWATDVAPLDLHAKRVSSFPSPFQIVVVEVLRTPALARALSSLRGEAKRRGLRDLARIAPEDWTFHMSVAYCSGLASDEWTDVCRWAETIVPPDGQAIIAEVEMVTFDADGELSLGRVALSKA